MFLRRSTIEFITYMYDNKGISKSENPFFGYYLHISYLKNMKLIKENGLNDKMQKIWILNDKGVEVAKRIKEIEELMLHE